MYNAHNTRSLIRAIKYVEAWRSKTSSQTKEASTVKAYKHTHTRTHPPTYPPTHTHTHTHTHARTHMHARTHVIKKYDLSHVRFAVWGKRTEK